MDGRDLLPSAQCCDQSAYWHIRRKCWLFTQGSFRKLSALFAGSKIPFPLLASSLVHPTSYFPSQVTSGSIAKLIGSITTPKRFIGSIGVAFSSEESEVETRIVPTTNSRCELKMSTNKRREQTLPSPCKHLTTAVHPQQHQRNTQELYSICPDSEFSQ